ncbi:MAG: biotin/lipoyl-binding protein [Prevotella sp.]|nr:biotin/lipoyl-binding protein [Prevotella sp.]
MNKYEYKVQGVDYTVEIEDVEGNVAKVNVNGIPFEVEMKQPIKAAPKVKKVEPAKVAAPAPAAPVAAPAAPAVSAAAGAGAKVTAPLPGTITDVKVAVGQSVNAGDVVVVLEAMKMQNNIEAENSGTVTSVMVNKGDTVMEGTVLVTIG